MKDFAKKTPDLILGVRPQKTERDEIASLREAGADFVVLDAESAMADALLEEKTRVRPAVARGLPMTRDCGCSPSSTSTRSSPRPRTASLTIERLLELRRVSALGRTPLFVEVSGDADASHLQALRESGVAGVIVEGSALGKLGEAERDDRRASGARQEARGAQRGDAARQPRRRATTTTTISTTTSVR